MVRGMVILAALALAGCDSVPQTWSRNDLEQIAHDAAADEVSGVDLDALESRLSDIETTMSDQESEISNLQSQVSNLESELAVYR